jgi:hypothetical protein
MYKLYALPQQRPGQMTVQASRADWQALAAALRSGDTDERQLGRHIERADLRDEVVRLTFPEQQARALLRAAGLAT